MIRGTVATVAVLAILLGLVFAFAVLLDYLGAATVYPKVMASFIVLGALLGAIVFFGTAKRPALLTVLVYVAALIALRLTVLSPVKPFREFHRSLQPGMSKGEVFGALRSHFPNHGRYRRPKSYLADDRTWSFTLDPDDGKYNSEIVLVRFVDGRMTAKKYLPD